MNGSDLKTSAAVAWKRGRDEARHFADPRTLRALCPALLAVALYPWIRRQVDRELLGPLFRDAAMCQYSGWCIRHGVKLYRDVGAPDGPFIHLLHALMQIFVGTSDAGCRRADLVVHLLGSSAMGAVLAPRFAASRLASITTRLGWAALGAALWFCWYLPAGGTTHTVQRDPYYALFGYLGMILIYASAERELAAARRMAFAGGFLVLTQIFTRQSGIIYGAMAVPALVFVDDADRALRMARIRAAAAGGAAAVVFMLGMVALVGSLPGFFFWYFRFTLIAYRFIGRNSPLKLMTETYSDAALLSVVVAVGVSGAVAARLLPRRALGFGFAPLLFLIAACMVGKGWPSHAMQTTAGGSVVLLVVLSHLWSVRSERRRWSIITAVPAVIALLYVANHAMEELQSGQFYSHSAEQFGDAAAAISVGKYIHDHTQPDDAVFLYGHEAHVLLAAERRPAIPYYVNMIFDIDSFISRQPPERGEEPNQEQMDSFHALQKRVATESCGRLGAAPPAAMVFLDRSLGVWGIPYGVADVARLCPDVPEMLKEHYHEVGVIAADYHVYLRNDRPSHRE